MANVVFRNPADKDSASWIVSFEGNIASPTFNSKGAAQAYLDMLERGQRQPESE